jgi:hypothetical protein
MVISFQSVPAIAAAIIGTRYTGSSPARKALLSVPAYHARRVLVAGALPFRLFARKEFGLLGAHICLLLCVMLAVVVSPPACLRTVFLFPVR